MENKNQEDLDLLLSLGDDERVLETPPGSPSAPPVYLTDEEGSPKRRRGNADLSDFRSVVQDCIDYDPKPLPKTTNKPKDNIEKFSGLRLRNQLLSPAEISDLFSDIRFVRLQTIKNLLMGDKLSGCWATMGVLTEKGQSKTSSIGQSYCIWKICSLNENNTVSLFLFGDAYKKNETEKAGCVFGLFNCSLRKDKMGSDFSLSVNSAKQMVKLGVSADYGVCTAKRKDGAACTSVVNKRQGAFCKIHKLNASDKFATMRSELKGGNLRTSFRDLKSRGIYTVEPPVDRSGNKKANQPVRVLSVEGLRKALSGADKVTPNVHSQGIRFLNEMAKQSALKNVNKKSETVNKSVEKRKASNTKETQVKRKREADKKETPEVATGKMMVLDFCSSDEE
ncbi:Minichromosome maintenance 10 [Hirschfeldia incana]|nr:Minichromosome maintenance 10 [Hirschfeldia incana]